MPLRKELRITLFNSLATKGSRMNSVRQRIFNVLDAVIARWPERNKELAELLGQPIPEGATEPFGDSFRLCVSPPNQVTSVPTFYHGTYRAPSEMLRARFEHSGHWQVGLERWLTPSEMASWIASEEVEATHHALRGYWENSAPMIFPDDRLGLFGVTEGVPEDLVYLAWADSDDEPEIWEYVGQSARRFTNLEHYLTRKAERD